MCEEPTNFSNSSWLIVLHLPPPIASSNSLEPSLLWFYRSGSRRQLLTVSGLYLSISTPSGSGKSGARHSRHLTSPAVLGLLPFIFLSPTWHEMTEGMREPKGSGNSLERCLARERLDKRRHLFFFFPAWSQQPETQRHCFPTALSFAFFQLLLSLMSLYWLRAPGGWCFQAPGSSFALPRPLRSRSGDEPLSWEHSSVRSFSEISFLPLFQTFLLLTFTSTINSRRLFWNLSTCELLHGMKLVSRAPGPRLVGVKGAGSPCRLESVL